VILEKWLDGEHFFYQSNENGIHDKIANSINFYPMIQRIFFTFVSNTNEKNHKL
jgi:hypothetical protein